jgi:hypothetical protein
LLDSAEHGEQLTLHIISVLIVADSDGCQ